MPYHAHRVGLLAFLLIIAAALLAVIVYSSGQAPGSLLSEAEKEEIFQDQAALIGASLGGKIASMATPVVDNLVVIRFAKGETASDSSDARLQLAERLEEWRKTNPHLEVLSVISVEKGYV